jgi:hypothetical protein
MNGVAARGRRSGGVPADIERPLRVDVLDRLCVCVCVCVQICQVYIYMYIYIYTYIYIYNTYTNI